MKLQLSNPTFEPSFKIQHTDNLFFIGSCFAENLAGYFEQRKFNVQKNPFGILYNPLSIANCLEQILDKKKYSPQDFYLQDGLYASWHHHSNLATTNLNELEKKLFSVNQNSFHFLQKANVVFITLGTPWVYWHKELEMVVANNLKAPTSTFEKKLLTVDEIKNSLQKMIGALRQLNKNVKIVFTLSPVRYSKQGIIESNRGKARLLDAIHTACEMDKALCYFPSYEIVIDVLRDYRFFEQDLVHPNSMATDYIWQFLEKLFLQETDKKLIDDLYKLHLATKHLLRHPSGEQAKKFNLEQLKKIKNLQAKYPYLNLEKEIMQFSSL